MPEENQNLKDQPQENPFSEEEKIPNAETRSAMEEARQMKGSRFATMEEMFASLDKAASESKTES